MSARVGIRWTIGDVHPRGFDALRLSVFGAWRVFGPDAEYAVCVNTVPLAEASARVGPVPAPLRWIDATPQIPPMLRPHLDAGLAEGAAWKLAPPRIFDDLWEISLDNDCILWDLPDGMRGWLEARHPARCLLAEDVRACFGRFAALCGTEPRNAGIRGMPPGFDLGAAVDALLRGLEAPLVSELDEQGLQVGALSMKAPPAVVAVEDVTICSPFAPHLPWLGRSGAHFVGLNARALPWSFDGRGASEWIADHWRSHQGSIRQRVGDPSGTLDAPAGI